MINVLFIGHSGYLGQHILNDHKIKKFNIVYFEGRVENISDFDKYYNYNFDQIWHFGSPNTYQKNIKSLIEQGTHNVVLFTNTQKAKLVYASSAAMISPQDDYGLSKRSSSMKIKHSVDDYVCLIIPRVYSKDREHGLIKYIKEGKPLDLSKQLFFINIGQFIDQFYSAIKNKNICYKFKSQNLKTIENIRDWIL